MGEAVVFEARQVGGIAYFRLYTGPSGVFLFKTLLDLVDHPGAGINGRDGDRWDTGAVGGKKSGDVPSSAASYV